MGVDVLINSNWTLSLKDVRNSDKLEDNLVGSVARTMVLIYSFNNDRGHCIRTDEKGRSVVAWKEAEVYENEVRIYSNVTVEYGGTNKILIITKAGERIPRRTSKGRLRIRNMYGEEIDFSVVRRAF